MIKRIAVLAVAMLVAATASSGAASRKKSKAPPAASASKKVESPKPPDSPGPDNVVLPADNGARAKAPAVQTASNPPEAAGSEIKPAEPDNHAAAAMGNDAEYDRRLLDQAVRLGILKKGAPQSALTPEVLNRMIDAYVLKDAVLHGLLPANAPPSQVTPEIRAVMKKGGYFIHYYPDGSINPNYGIR